MKRKIVTGETDIIRNIRPPLPLCPPQIPYGLELNLCLQVVAST
jgi:hypothetical protein